MMRKIFSCSLVMSHYHRHHCFNFEEVHYILLSRGENVQSTIATLDLPELSSFFLTHFPVGNAVVKSTSEVINQSLVGFLCNAELALFQAIVG